MRTQGEASGASYMLEALLGAEGYNALLNFDDLTEEDLEKIVNIAFGLVAGAMDKAKK
jgi:hypothetical protein